MRRAALNDYAIGYASMPQPPDTTREDAREDAISARFDEIWADPDLLHYAMDDGSLPFTLHTATILRDCARRLSLCGNTPISDAETFVLAVVQDLHDCVKRAAVHDIDNADWEP
jgi:hypothetical protein